MSDALIEFVAAHSRLLVISGAGLSTASGIGDYRNAAGEWKQAPPIQHAEFVGSEAGRRRYWARSVLGWPQFALARPNAGHRALAALERRRRVLGVVTQNVDRLHQLAGGRRVIDLHGRLDRVRCLDCGDRSTRAALQTWLETNNRAYLARYANAELQRRPDGDVEVLSVPADFALPACERCGGVLKPDVVFYGDSVPKIRVERAFRWLSAAEAVLVVGSSLMVFSSFRFVRAAHKAGKPIAILNRGRTRGDDLLGSSGFKIEAECAPALAELNAALPR